MRRFGPVLTLCLAAWAAAPACADIAVSSNDGHTVLLNGNPAAAKPPLPDTIAVIDMSKVPPRITATIDVPGSVAGPPTAVWVAPDESWCIVTSASKVDPDGPSGLAPDDRLSVVDLKLSPPKVVQTISAGAGATSVRVSPDGTLALVANQIDGTVSIFTVKDHRLTAAGKVEFGNPKSAPSGVAFTKDGLSALVSRGGDNMVSVLHIEGTRITVDPRPLTTAVRPYMLDVNAAGTLAAVANLGRGDGDIDSVSIIDLTGWPFRTVETFAVPRGPQGLKFSPDGRFLAVASQLGTQKPPGHVFRTERGILTFYTVNGDTDHGIEPDEHHVRRVSDAQIGGWSQGIAFSKDSRTILVQDMIEQKIQVFRWLNGRLEEGQALPIKGGPAAIRTPWP